MLARRLARPALLLVALLVAACGGAPASGAPAASTAASSLPATGAPATTPPTPTALTVGLGYIPSVQFAPFYLADQAGYYRDAGLTVTFQNKIDPDLVTLVGQGSIDIGLADGTSVIPAVSQGIPVQYIATIYRDFPSIVFAKATSGITSAADLKGRKIGIPGRYGSSWVMLQALLGSAGLKATDVQIIEYPTYGQGAAVQQGAVDAATGFFNNEPVQLKLAGFNPVILHVDSIVALPGPGLISSKTTLSTKGAAITAFVAATLRAMSDIAANPTLGLDATIKVVPELAADRAAQAAILNATITAWKGTAANAPAMGTIDIAGWTASAAFMTTLGLVANPVKVEDLVRSDMLPH